MAEVDLGAKIAYGPRSKLIDFVWYVSDLKARKGEREASANCVDFHKPSVLVSIKPEELISGQTEKL